MTRPVDKPFGAPRPADTTPAVDPVIGPCPGCGKTSLTRVADDLGALYQCNQCDWDLFMAWTDLEQRSPARRSAAQCVNSRTGGRMTVQLPTKPRARDGGPMTSRVLLVGHPKVGKSTCAAQWAPKETLILDTHVGTKLIPGEHYVTDIKTFGDFEQAVDLIVKGGHQFKTIVIDTIDDIYRFADKRAGENHKKIAAGLVEFGKGGKEADALFFREIEKLLAAPVGIWFIGHAETEQVDNDTRYVPKLDKRVRSWVEGVCDFIWFAQRIGPRAQIQTQPSARFEAGSRVNLPNPMPLDARAIYTAMDKGFNPPAAASPAAPTTTTNEKAAA